MDKEKGEKNFTVEIKKDKTIFLTNLYTTILFFKKFIKKDNKWSIQLKKEKKK